MRNALPEYCHECLVRDFCGGSGDFFSCFYRCRHCSPDLCQEICPANATDFVARYAEVGGFSATRGYQQIDQRSSDKMPRYLPVIYNSTRRVLPLTYPYVALPLCRIIGGDATKFRLLVNSENELRCRFAISSQTQFLTLGCGKDHFIENLWANLEKCDLFELLSSCGVRQISSPNYSFFTDMLQTTRLYNLRRIIRVTEILQQYGLIPIPHLNAGTPGEWKYWEAYLKEQPQIHVVAKEFATGLSQPKQGELALNEMVSLQQRIGRALHVVAIGGCQYINLLNREFEDWTVTDPEPYLKTMQRRVAKKLSGDRMAWMLERTVGEEPLDKRLETAIQLSERAVLAGSTPRREIHVEPRQLSLDI